MGGGISGNIGWFQRWLYNAKDSVTNSNPTYGYQNYKTTFADSIFNGNQIGAVWGVAYDESKKRKHCKYEFNDRDAR